MNIFVMLPGLVFFLPFLVIRYLWLQIGWGWSLACELLLVIEFGKEGAAEVRKLRNTIIRAGAIRDAATRV